MSRIFEVLKQSHGVLTPGHICREVDDQRVEVIGAPEGSATPVGSRWLGDPATNDYRARKGLIRLYRPV